MFRGTFTALVTPFGQDGEIDFARLRDFVGWQVEQGVDGLVPVGSTGECPTLSFEEHCRVIEAVVGAAAGRVPVIAGAGGNSTAEALELTRRAKAAGATATLQVAPYYNKPSQEGVYRHFSQVADVGLPVVLYNIPGRSGITISVDTVCRLSKHPGIVAIKEASGDVGRVTAIRQCCGIDVISGDDGLTLPMIAVGATGVISVVSNAFPGDVCRMVNSALGGDFSAALKMHDRLYPMFRDMFIETNPVPVKEALGIMGKIEPRCRLPLCELSRENRAKLEATLSLYGVGK